MPTEHGHNISKKKLRTTIVGHSNKTYQYDSTTYQTKKNNSEQLKQYHWRSSWWDWTYDFDPQGSGFINFDKIHWCSCMSECYNIGEWDQWSRVMYFCFKHSRYIHVWCKKQIDLISSFRFCFDHTFVRVCCWFRYFLNLMNALINKNMTTTKILNAQAVPALVLQVIHGISMI